MSTDDLLGEATRLAGDYRNLDEGRVLRALVERVQQAEREAETQAGIAAIRTAERDDVARDGRLRLAAAERERDSLRFELDGARAVARKDNEFLLSVRDAAWAERDAARGKLDKVRDLATQWAEEAGDYVPPLPPDEPYSLMVNHSRAVLDILGDIEYNAASDVLAILDGKAPTRPQDATNTPAPTRTTPT